MEKVYIEPFVFVQFRFMLDSGLSYKKNTTIYFNFYYFILPSFTSYSRFNIRVCMNTELNIPDIIVVEIIIPDYSTFLLPNHQRNDLGHRLSGPSRTPDNALLYILLVFSQYYLLEEITVFHNSLQDKRYQVNERSTSGLDRIGKSSGNFLVFLGDN